MMSHSLRVRPLRLAAAALLLSSSPLIAQSTTPAPPAQPPAAADTRAPNPAEALMNARNALNTLLSTPAQNQQTFDKLNEIKTHYLELEKAYSTRGDWQSRYAAINQNITEIMTAAAPSTETATSPTTLDATSTANLGKFKKALADFAAAMGGAPSPGSPTTPPAVATGGSSETAPPQPAGTSGQTPAPAKPSQPPDDLAEIDRLIRAALSGGVAGSGVAATTGGTSTICVERKTLEEIQTRVAKLVQQKKQPQ
jgi:hypothetical protein